MDILIDGDFNVDMASPDRQEHNETIVATMAMEMEGLKDMAAHFVPHNHHCMRGVSAEEYHGYRW